MVSTIVTQSGTTMYIRDPQGSPGFVAVVNPADATLLEVGYNSTFMARPTPIVEPSSQLLTGRTELEAFLLTMYFSKLEFSGDNKFDLHADIEREGEQSQYASLKLADFMAFLGAKDRFFKDANGATKNIMDEVLVNPSFTRPLLVDMKSLDNTLMFRVIRHLGIFGIIPYLFAAGGITFEEFCEEVKAYYPNIADRSLYYYTNLVGFLRSMKVPMLKEEERIALLS